MLILLRSFLVRIDPQARLIRTPFSWYMVSVIARIRSRDSCLWGGREVTTSNEYGWSKGTFTLLLIL